MEGIHGMHIPHSHRAHAHKTHPFKTSEDFAVPTSRSEERKMAEKFAKMIDSRSFSPRFFAHFFTYENMEAQFAMYEIMVYMIDHWAELYNSGEVGPHSLTRVQRICQWAARVQRS